MLKSDSSLYFIEIWLLPETCYNVRRSYLCLWYILQELNSVNIGHTSQSNVKLTFIFVLPTFVFAMCTCGSILICYMTIQSVPVISICCAYILSVGGDCPLLCKFIWWGTFYRWAVLTIDLFSYTVMICTVRGIISEGVQGCCHVEWRRGLWLCASSRRFGVGGLGRNTAATSLYVQICT